MNSTKVKSYFIVGLCEDYMKDGGRYGIVNPDKDIPRYIIKDGLPFPFEKVGELEFVWSEQDSYKTLADYQITLFAFRIISLKLKTILEQYTDKKVTVFHPVLVNKDNTLHQYFILHFNEILDVIDEEKSYKNSIVPTVDANKLNGINVFSITEGFDNSFCVSDIVKEQMVKENITGCEFVIISDNY